jgi:hypothetical protein
LIYYGSPDIPSKQDDRDGVDGIAAVTVHGDALLLEVTTTRKSQKHRPCGASTSMTDYFVYDNGPARPPTLVLFPDCYFAWQFEHDKKAHGRLRPTARKMNTFNTNDDDLLEAGIKGDDMVRQWQTVTAVPAADRFLCWADYRYGFLLCDMAADEASPKLRYVALTMRPHNMGVLYSLHEIFLEPGLCRRWQRWHGEDRQRRAPPPLLLR